MKQKRLFQTQGHKLFDAEFNLANAFRRLIIYALLKYPHEPMNAIAGRLGISAKTLYRVRREWDIPARPNGLRKNRRQKGKKEKAC